MKMPTLEQAQCWIDFSQEQIDRAYRLLQEGRRKFTQSFHTTVGGLTADLGRSRYLAGHAISDVHGLYRRASELMEVSFIMAYDSSSPQYIGNTDKVDWSDVDEVCCLEMMNWALIAHDFEYAMKIVQWVRPSPDNDPMPPEVVHYVYALKYALEGDWQNADEMNSRSFEMYQSQAPNDNSYRHNYYSLSWALAGILRQDDAMFNEGLRQQFLFYRSYAEGEAEGTSEQYICDNALALAVLGKKTGRTITLIDEDYLPLDLI